ncbi:AAA family ATPase [Ktedonobacter racemifer]|uniref:ATPase associated with various cellular activities AAA_5 n=1 Tax=Ktedonobacter racemifer DSM 44963 TaxID=485913 RepID=D6U8M3_KTERA|nr:MoxR family ATPase [Ktedonobacter racemifer]EFH80234.1 ATPase associated with various cellular activities AAA_5 [Ktedonobacter racemifer DSM 44963]
MANTLNELVASYLADTADHEEAKKLIEERKPTFPILQAIIYAFIEGHTPFSEFRERLGKALRPAEVWYAQGRFMMELNKFGKNHNDPSEAPANEFRQILQGLNGRNVGHKIEQFYQFLLKERNRLRHEGKLGGGIVAPGNSAYMISLFALWLDPEGGVITCSEGIRKGLNRFIKAGFIPEIPGLKLNATTIDITTAQDYEAFLEANRVLLKRAPGLDFIPYWSEFFFYWVLQQEQSSKAGANTLIKEDDPSDLLTDSSTQAGRVQERSSDWSGNKEGYTTPSFDTKLIIPNEPLKPTPEPLLSRLIHEVQRHILVDEAVIRRIYHALLAGHVILSGPPGTGKTEMARLIPELLWRSEKSTSQNGNGAAASFDLSELSTETAYSTRLVTATDDWTPRTLISNIAPVSKNGTVSYKVQFGHLTATIQKNWSFQGATPEEWSHVSLRRARVSASSSLERSTIQTFKGQWLVIDEFNRAPIDLALGEAMTSLSTNDHLRVNIEGGSAELPIPQDFRIIGTLNSFDRNYLNQISEALKRRFSFIEILPPTRAMREAEQGIVLYKALQKVRHLTEAENSLHTITIDDDQWLTWNDSLSIGPDDIEGYAALWDEKHHFPFQEVFSAAWNIFEVIRIYRQLGTAQAITLVRHMLIAGLLQGYTTREQWLQALDAALCDTIADQLQVLLPDELAVLLLYLTSQREAFQAALQRHLDDLGQTTHNRLYRQLLAFGSVSDEQGQPYLNDIEIERIAAKAPHTVPAASLRGLYHLDHELPVLPQFTRRLRTFKAERGL